MLDHYFVRPETVNRIRSSWIGPLIEQYLMSLHERGYAVRRLGQRVPILVQFGKFAQTHGAQSYAELPAYLEPFVAAWINRPDRARKSPTSSSHPRGSRCVGADARYQLARVCRDQLLPLAGAIRRSCAGFPHLSSRGAWTAE